MTHSYRDLDLSHAGSVLAKEGIPGKLTSRYAFDTQKLVLRHDPSGIERAYDWPLASERHPIYAFVTEVCDHYLAPEREALELYQEPHLLRLL